MNRYLPVVSTLGIITAITLQPQAVLALEPAEIYAKAKEFTVQIDGEETGTGTIIDRNNDTYTVITCWHVMDTPGNYQVTTPDGNTHQVTNVENLPDIDLATITFNSSNTYPVAEMGDSTQATSGLDAYVVGYPDPFPGVPERQYFTDSTEVQSRLTQGENGYQIIHDGSFTPGSSGGGIFDREARLIGVNGQFISEGNTGKDYGTGIPLEIYLAAADSFTTPTNVLPPQDFVSIGKRKLKQKDYTGAVAEFDRALVNNPNDLEALAGRGEAYFWLDNFSAANDDFNVALARDANNVFALNFRGLSYAELEEHKKAIADFTESISINPEDARVYAVRGASYNNLKEYKKAIADLTQAIDLNLQDARVYRLRGESYAELEEYNRAIADFTQAISINPEDALVYGLRGESYIKLEEYDRAIADLTQAIDLNLQDARVYRLRGASYAKLEEYNKAIADFTQAISINPEDALVYAGRGVVYNELGETREAIKDLQQAADLFKQQGDLERYKRYNSAIEAIRELQ